MLVPRANHASGGHCFVPTEQGAGVCACLAFREPHQARERGLQLNSEIFVGKGRVACIQCFNLRDVHIGTELSECVSHTYRRNKHTVLTRDTEARFVTVHSQFCRTQQAGQHQKPAEIHTMVCLPVQEAACTQSIHLVYPRTAIRSASAFVLGEYGLTRCSWFKETIISVCVSDPRFLRWIYFSPRFLILRRESDPTAQVSTPENDGQNKHTRTQFPSLSSASGVARRDHSSGGVQRRKLAPHDTHSRKVGSAFAGAHNELMYRLP